ncbi:hypothetical protein FWG86_01285 [Candidatus Saccharibacteria bacterium]|nr:hypothetical protein [Candidatus Saccharibacteria bacterium]
MPKQRPPLVAAGVGTTRLRRLRRIRGSTVAGRSALARALVSSRSAGLRAPRVRLLAGGLSFPGSSVPECLS